MKNIKKLSTLLALAVLLLPATFYGKETSQVTTTEAFDIPSGFIIKNKTENPIVIYFSIQEGLATSHIPHMIEANGTLEMAHEIGAMDNVDISLKHHTGPRSYQEIPIGSSASGYKIFADKLISTQRLDHGIFRIITIEDASKVNLDDIPVLMEEPLDAAGIQIINKTKKSFGIEYSVCSGFDKQYGCYSKTTQTHFILMKGSYTQYINEDTLPKYSASLKQGGYSQTILKNGKWNVPTSFGENYSLKTIYGDDGEVTIIIDYKDKTKTMHQEL